MNFLGAGLGKVLTKTVQRKVVGLKRLEWQAPIDAVQVFVDSRANGDSAIIWFRYSCFRLERSTGEFRIPEAHFPQSFVGVVLGALGEPTKNKDRAFWVDFLEVNFLPGALALDGRADDQLNYDCFWHLHPP